MKYSSLKDKQTNSNYSFSKKLTAVIILFLIWIAVRIFYLKEDEGVVDFPYCFNDKLLTVILNPITRFFSQNLMYRDFLIILASSILDVGLFTFVIVYIFKGNSWKHTFTLILFYGTRALLQSVFMMEFYGTYLVENPGFLSIVVPFHRTPDFFYSGHTGCTMILSMSFKDFGYTFLHYFYLCVLLLEVFTLNVTRSHYSIDIIIGFMAGHLCFVLCGIISESFLDKYLPICGKKLEKKRKDSNNSNYRAKSQYRV